MEESWKNRIILILLILVIIFFVSTIASCGNASRQRLAREKELTARLDMEEKINKTIQEEAAVGEKLKALGQELENEKSAHQATIDTLEEQRLVVKGLKEELEKVTKVKEALE